MVIRYGGNPNVRDSVSLIPSVHLFVTTQIGNTPMHFAVQSKSLSIVRLLDQHNGNGQAKNQDGVSPIDLCITEDIRDIKLHFMSQSKYRTVSFN